MNISGLKNKKSIAVLLMCSTIAGCSQYIPSSRVIEISNMSDDHILDHPVQAAALLSPDQVNALKENSLAWSVGKSLADSPIIKQAYYGLSSTSVGIAEAQSLRGPQLSLSGQYGATDSSGNEAIRSNHILGFNGSITLFDGGANALKTDQARWQAMGALASVGERIQYVSQSVAEAYIGILKSKDDYRLTTKQANEIETIVNEVKRLSAAGATNASDVPEAEARLQLFRQRVVQSRQSLSDAEAKLRRFTGNAPDIESMERPKDAPVLKSSEEELVGEAINHPSVKMLDYEIQAAIKAVCAVDAERNGNLILQLGTAGLASAFLGKSVIELGSSLLNLTLPLIDSGSRDARLKHSASDLEVSLARRVDIERSVGFTVRQAVHARDAAISAAKIASIEYEKQTQVAKIKRIDYRAGIVDLKAVLDAEQTRMDAEIKYSDSGWDRTLSTYQLLGTQGKLAEYLHVVTYRTVDVKGVSDPFPQPTLLQPTQRGIIRNIPVVP